MKGIAINNLYLKRWVRWTGPTVLFCLAFYYVSVLIVTPPPHAASSRSAVYVDLEEEEHLARQVTTHILPHPNFPDRALGAM